MKFNPTAQLKGLSLPTELGGWVILLPRTPNTDIIYQDVNNASRGNGSQPG